MISIEQNSVFRVLSIASLIFMPPTLVAGIYGMNFKLMPELDWHWGYPLALLLMVFAAILPYAYLKKRGAL
jgi:magnesium transporter